MTTLDKLKNHLARIADIQSANALLGWDQHTYMPKGSLEPRIRQMTTLEELSHDLWAAPQLGEWLQELEEQRDQLPAIEQSLLRVVHREVGRATRLPLDLVRRRSELTGRAMDCWMTARPKSDYKTFQPYLKDLIQLCRDEADAYGYDDQAYDALLGLYEPGLATRTLQDLFSELRDQLVPFCHQIFEVQDRVKDDFLYKNFDKDQQWELGLRILKAMGYNFDCGRQDLSAHPFTTGFGIQDIRVTTRIIENDFKAGLYGSIHEGGHALYEQNIDLALDRGPLAEGTSLGIHESQSRLWENLVGRSRPFWERWFGDVKDLFPSQLGGLSFREFYHGINRVKPSLIRVEADEVTYSLHIFIRFELELALLSGDLDSKDLPEAWAQKSRDYLGITPPDDGSGCLQDMHWADGTFGYFPTYALGNLYGVPFYRRAQSEMPDLEEQIASGNMLPLKEWLSKQIYRHGRSLDPQELLKAVTGEELSVEPFMSYIRGKYSEIYDLD